MRARKRISTAAGIGSVAGLALTLAARMALATTAAADVPEVRALLMRTPAQRVAIVHGLDLRFRSLADRAPSGVSEDRRTQWRFSCRRAGNGAPGRVIFEKTGIELAAHASALPSGRSRMRVLDSPVRVESAAGMLRLENRPYRGRLLIHARPTDDGCDVVNELDLEQYLDGLVNSEFSSKWAPEGVAAQVVAARTYALHQMQEARRKGRHWDLETTEKDQVYGGSAREDWKGTRVIERTRGEVLVPNGTALARSWDQQKLLKAFYHSTCGGFTELPENVWGVKSPGYRREVGCGFCAASPRYRWSLELHEKEIRERLAALLGAEPSLFPGVWRETRAWARRPLQSLRVEKSTRTRTLKLRADFGAGLSLPISSALLRQAVGYGVLKSTAFRVASVAGGKFRFDGNGSGHGVGMCQWGAKVMGEKGYSHDRILARYYPDARIVHLW
jgi:stage II sporulation protein D